MSGLSVEAQEFEAAKAKARRRLWYVRGLGVVPGGGYYVTRAGGPHVLAERLTREEIRRIEAEE